MALASSPSTLAAPWRGQRSGLHLAHQDIAARAAPAAPSEKAPHV